MNVGYRAVLAALVLVGCCTQALAAGLPPEADQYCTAYDKEVAVKIQTDVLQYYNDVQNGRRQPDPLALGQYIMTWGPQMTPLCRAYFNGISPKAPEVCTTKQKQAMIAYNGTIKFPQPARIDCWNF